MACTRILLANLVLAAVVGAGVAEAQEGSRGLGELVGRLNLKDRGVETWLERLEAASGGPVAERLLIVSETGDPLAERISATTSVVIDRDLDRLLRDDGKRVVMIHNHPSSVGLSAADIGHLGKPGVLAIVAVGHDRSVFVAAAGRAMEADWLEARQYSHALIEARRRLLLEWPSAGASAETRDAQLSHLVSRALAQAGIIQYWFDLRGNSRASYNLAQAAFNRVVAGTAAYLRRVEKPALSARR